MEIKQKDWRCKTAKIFSNLMYLVDAKIIADLHESIDSLIVSLLSHCEKQVKRELREKLEKVSLNTVSVDDSYGEAWNDGIEYAISLLADKGGETMNEEVIKKIEEDIKKNVGWMENGKQIGLPDVALSTIMSIIQVNLDKMQRKKYNEGFYDGVKAQQDVAEKEYQAQLKDCLIDAKKLRDIDAVK